VAVVAPADDVDRLGEEAGHVVIDVEAAIGVRGTPQSIM
jgi:hypothetical protein